MNLDKLPNPHSDAESKSALPAPTASSPPSAMAHPYLQTEKNSQPQAPSLLSSVEQSAVRPPHSAITVASSLQGAPAPEQSAFRNPQSTMADPYLQTEKTASTASARPDGQAETSSLPDEQSALRSPDSAIEGATSKSWKKLPSGYRFSARTPKTR